MKRVVKTCMAFFIALWAGNLNAQMVNVTLEAHNVWGDGSGYQLLLDATATQYGVTIPLSGFMSETCFPPEDLYDVFSSKIPEDAFPACNTTTVVVDGSVTIQIPAGIYDWCITNPDPNGRIWIPAGNGENAAIRDNYLFEEGKAYHFLMEMIGFFDGVYITITDEGVPCPTVTNVTASVAEGNKVKLTWVAPSGKALVNYKIYQNGVETAIVESGITEWTSNVLTSGNYIFSVAAVYEATDDCTPVKVETPEIQIKTCDGKVSNLSVDFDEECTKAAIKWSTPEKMKRGEIFNNGPFITHPGQGAGGADASAYNAPFSSAYGIGANITTGYMVGDDFTLEDDYRIETIDFFGYQAGAGETSTFTGVYVQIYEGSPMAGGKLIWGNTTTNRMIATSYSNVNRVSPSNLTSTDRRIMKVTAEIGTELFAGITYWLVWGYTGSLSQNPSQIPVTVFGQPETGNGITRTPSGWEIAQDQFTNAIYDFVFTIHGEVVVNEEKQYNVYRDGIKIAGPIDDDFYDDLTFDKFKEHTYSVAVACLNGGDGEWVSIKTDPCTDDTPINEIKENDVYIFPNPTDGQLKIATSEYPISDIRIYDIVGKLVGQSEIGYSEIEINISNLPTGIYFIRIQTENGVVTRKVVKM